MKRTVFLLFVAAYLLTNTLHATLSTPSILASEPKVVRNSDKGLWQEDPSKKFELITDLVIGAEDGEDDEILGRVRDVAVGSNGDIYILDNGFLRIQMYDSGGSYQRTFGRKGEGPGEFSYPTAMAIDRSDNLYVADISRVNVYDRNGDYLTQFKHELSAASGVIRSIAVYTSSEIYISCFEVFEQQVIHRFALEHGFLLSFCDSYAVGKDIDVRIETAYAGGQIDVDRHGVVYYAQMTPYEIRKFSSTGELLSVIHRENNFLQPEVEIEGDMMKLGMFTGSSSIVVLSDGMFINVLKTPVVPDEPNETIIDLFDGEGKLLSSRRFDKNIDVKCRDDVGRLYGIDLEEYPKVVRYRIAFD